MGNLDMDKKRTSQNSELAAIDQNRRDFVKAATIIGGGIALSTVAVIKAKLPGPPKDPVGRETTRKLADTPTVPIDKNSDPLIRMQEELRRAMAKPVEARHWRMVIDTRKCVGCHACTIACIAENKLPPGVVYRPVVSEELGEFPNLGLRFTPRPCMQCEEPPCVPVCPVIATWKRPDGVVAIDYDKCIGCGYCITACPYNARTRDLGEFYTEGTPAVKSYEKEPNFEYGKNWDRSHH